MWCSIILQRPSWIGRTTFWKNGAPTTWFASSRRFQPNPGDVNTPVRGLTEAPPRVIPGPPLHPPPPPPSLCIWRGRWGWTISSALSMSLPLTSSPILEELTTGSISSGENALLEAALAPGMTPYLHPPYLWTGHYSPTSPSAASFQERCLS